MFPGEVTRSGCSSACQQFTIDSVLAAFRRRMCWARPPVDGQHLGLLRARWLRLCAWDLRCGGRCCGGKSGGSQTPGQNRYNQVDADGNRYYDDPATGGRYYEDGRVYGVGGGEQYIDYTTDPRYKNLSISQKRAVRSLQRRVNEHIIKRDNYAANPDAYDNRGILRNAPSSQIRNSIIQGRINHLNGKINSWKSQIEAILDN